MKGCLWASLCCCSYFSPPVRYQRPSLLLKQTSPTSDTHPRFEQTSRREADQQASRAERLLSSERLRTCRACSQPPSDEYWPVNWGTVTKMFRKMLKIVQKFLTCTGIGYLSVFTFWPAEKIVPATTKEIVAQSFFVCQISALMRTLV